MLRTVKKCKKKVVDRLAPAGFDLGTFQAYLRVETHYLDGTQSLARPKGMIYPTGLSANAFVAVRGLPDTALISAEQL